MKTLKRKIKKWRFAIDRGGTFTDVIGISPTGELHVAKVLSQIKAKHDAGISGIREILNIPQSAELPSKQIAWIRMGTTIATNALLERKGIPTGLLITRGFRDLLEIGTQDRPDLFALAIKKPEIIYKAVEEVRERTGSDGKLIVPIDKENLMESLCRLKASGVESIAIVFLFSWMNPKHEIIARDTAISFGFKHVSTSHQTMPVIKAVERGRTTLVDAYLTPILQQYASGVRKDVGKIPIFFMSSSGGLSGSENFTGKDAILSGPAGGALGIESISRLACEEAVIGFDMGGTSTDVCRWSGSLEKTLEVETGGVRFTTPMLAVKTVAAGGGSILSFDGRKMTVGPESSGAYPGPACYGHGGPASITDANLVLGRIKPEYFPNVFGKKHNEPLNRSLSYARFADIAKQIKQAQGLTMSVESLALGFIRIANEMMSRPIKEISIGKGHDIRTHTLVCFGGAGAQHGCGIARALGINKILIPQYSSLLSAFGILTAPHRKTKIETFLARLNQETLLSARKRAKEIVSELDDAIRKEITTNKSALFSNKIELDIRTTGTDTPLTIPIENSSASLKHLFMKMHITEYGFKPLCDDVEIVNIRVEVSEIAPLPKELFRSKPPESSDKAKPVKKVHVIFESEGECETPVYQRDSLIQDDVIKGPALVVEPHTTTVVEPGFTLTIEETGMLKIILRKQSQVKASSKYDPVLLEVFHHLFMGVAEQMGKRLQHTAHSVNIKERLDFSCAIFDDKGHLVANAPHIPVHLGAMGETVRHIIMTHRSSIKSGEFYCSNDPYSGGSHLPDITVVAPAFIENKPAFYLASRGHHADIGGISPGSMYPFATKLEEEGVLLRNLLIVRKNCFHEKHLVEKLQSGIYPARNIPERIADIQAQIAAVRLGISEIGTLCGKYGLKVVRAYMNHVRIDARHAMEEALDEFLGSANKKSYFFSDCLDSGARIQAKITIQRNHENRVCTVIDFTGTDAAQDNSLNAPPAVTKAAVLYVLRTLIKRPIPLNDGCLEHVKIIIPHGSILNPPEGYAVCGGNVETSQRIVDVLYGALGIAAASQGTMNNVSFGDLGNTGSQYYETIAGGSGAIDGAHGASAVQVHMTNTRITDPEVIETRFSSVLLEKFLIRIGSGGDGRWHGGDGVIRAYRFLKPQEISILSDRRRISPFGLKGGNPGAPGENILIKKNGSVIRINGYYHGFMDVGDVLEIHTPGGGGFGQTDK